MPEPPLRVVAWETTRRCHLNCRHCRGAALDADYSGELSTAEGRRLIDGLAAFARPVLILTGGEPMARHDIYELARYATDAGLRAVMAPCGHLITPATARRLVESGVRFLSISIDGPDAETHDAFRGVPGAFRGTLQGLQHAKDAGILFQVNTTVTCRNVHHLDAIYELALELGAEAFDLFFLVPTGRGAELKGLELSPQLYESTLHRVNELAKKSPIRVKTTCAPHYARIVALEGGDPRERRASGCMAGRGFMFISHRGVVQPCGFLDLTCGDVRKSDFDIEDIYTNSPRLRELRRVDDYGGKCGVCEFRRLCGGCRARAYEHTGDYMAAEPACAYVPKAQR